VVETIIDISQVGVVFYTSYLLWKKLKLLPEEPL
jgi:hypothetical protein